MQTAAAEYWKLLILHLDLTLVVNISLGICKHFCLHGPTHQRHFCLKVRFINGLTYLLITYLSWASYLHLCASVTKQYNLVPAKGQQCSSALKITVGLVENNGSLPPSLLSHLKAGSRLFQYAPGYIVLRTTRDPRSPCLCDQNITESDEPCDGQRRL